MHRANYVSAARTSYVTRSDSVAGAEKPASSFGDGHRSLSDVSDAAATTTTQVILADYRKRSLVDPNEFSRTRTTDDLPDTHYVYLYIHDCTVSYRQHIHARCHPCMGACRIFPVVGKLGVCGFGALESINSPMGFNLFIVFRNLLRYRSVYDS